MSQSDVDRIWMGTVWAYANVLGYDKDIVSANNSSVEQYDKFRADIKIALAGNDMFIEEPFCLSSKYQQAQNDWKLGLTYYDDYLNATTLLIAEKNNSAMHRMNPALQMSDYNFTRNYANESFNKSTDALSRVADKMNQFTNEPD
jgi:hypothetical protein